MNYYERYVGDYTRKTGHLSLIEIGAYDRLLDHYYGTEEALPNDIDALCRIARAMTPAERKAVQSVIAQFFYLGDDGLLHNRKADEVLGNAQPRIEAAKLNGRRGGRPRKETQEKPSGFPNQNPTGTQEEPRSKALQHQHHISLPDGKEKERVSLPDWLTPEAWGEFIAHRKTLKSPMTPLAQRKAIEELARLREQGYEPKAVLDQSISNGWKGVFPVKNQPAQGRRRTIHDERADTIAALTGRDRERDDGQIIEGYAVPVD